MTKVNLYNATVAGMVGTGEVQVGDKVVLILASHCYLIRCVATISDITTAPLADDGRELVRK